MFNFDLIPQRPTGEDGTFDAGEIDQEIIASRLQQDVVRQTVPGH